MRYQRTGRHGLVLPRLSLGFWHHFGHSQSIETQRSIVRRAFDLGITHFDLANDYGPPPGSAESNFGRIFFEDLRPYRDELIVSTKAGYDMWPGPYGEFGSRKYLLASLDQSLKRLGLDYVDIFYSHRPDPNTPIEETMGALSTAVSQGKALYAGISSYTPQQTREASAALTELKVPLVVHQPEYSMFNRQIEHGLFPVLNELGIGCVVFSPLAQGMLTDRYLNGGIPPDSRAAVDSDLRREQISDAYLRNVRHLNQFAADRGQTLAQLALTWVLRQPEVTSALLGPSTVAQLEQDVAALHSSPLTPEELSAIDAWL